MDTDVNFQNLVAEYVNQWQRAKYFHEIWKPWQDASGATRRIDAPTRWAYAWESAQGARSAQTEGQ
jgi:hypothetical protein